METSWKLWVGEKTGETAQMSGGGDWNLETLVTKWC